MKVLAVVFSTLFFSSFAFGSSNEFPAIETLAPVSKVFVPVGFDSNDISEVIVQGVFPNGCYRVWQNGYKIDERSKSITVWVTAFMNKSELCAEVMTPYIVSVKLGILNVGDYQVNTLGFEGETPALGITYSTTESPDEFLYAPVEGADIKVDDSGRQSLNIFGRFPISKRGCLIVDEIIQNPIENEVLVVLPKMKQLYGDACEGAEASFDLTIGLVAPVENHSLLHLRSINGNSYSRFIHLD